jgi:hypothetical protein
MRPSFPRILSILLLACCSFLSTAQAQIATVTVKSLDALRSDLKYLAPLLQLQEPFKRADAVLGQIAASKALHTNKPFGAYFHWPERLDEVLVGRVPVVYFAPVGDEKQIFELLKAWGWTSQKADPDMYRLSLAKDEDFFLRIANGHAYLAEKQANLKGRLPEPATLLPSTGQKNSLAATFRPDRLPDRYEKMISKAVEPTLEPVAEMFYQTAGKQPGETDELYKQRKANAKKVQSVIPLLLEQALAGLVAQVREVNLSLDINQNENRLALEFSVVPTSADNDLAKFCRYAAGSRSRFSQVISTAAVGAYLHCPGPFPLVPPEQLPEQLRDYIEEAYRETALKSLQLFVATVAVDGLDCCLTMHDGQLQKMLFGLKIQNGRKVEHLFRDTLQNLPSTIKKDYPSQWNIAQHAKARIHKFRLTGEDDDDYLAIRDDVVFMGEGKSGLNVLKQAVDAFDRNVEASATPLLAIDVNSDLFLHDAPEPVRSLLSSIGKNKARTTFRVQGGKELRFKLEMDSMFLRLLVLSF